MAEEFKRLRRDLVYKGSIIDYYKDTVQVPNGNVVKWDFIGHKGAAAIVPVREDGKILMVRQYRNALDCYTLEIPAGGLNGADEPTKTAAARELEEETGYRADTLIPLGHFYPACAYSDETIWMYLAKGLHRGPRHLDDDEFLDVELIPLKELVDQVLAGKIPDAKTQIAILKAACHEGLL